MGEADQKDKAPLDSPGGAAFDPNLGARDSLEQNSQPYSTVTDLARLRG
ncbi:MAG TPA: hypothetical protein VFS56_09830 [Gemmatimonadaceae bacterium]|nr:hypothetical protein [Gemmatimonadaceae bacterium]